MLFFQKVKKVKLFLILVLFFYLLNINLNALDERIYSFSLEKADKNYLKYMEEENYSFHSLNFLDDDLALYWKNRYYELFNEINELSNFSLSEKSIQYAKPTSHNFMILLKDLVHMKEDYQSYAKIYIDRQFIGETSHGLRSQVKEIKLNLQINHKFLLNVEKYVFNPFKKTWERELNLYQPKNKYLTIPEDKILVYEIIYDSSKESPETSHLKYDYLNYFLVQ